MEGFHRRKGLSFALVVIVVISTLSTRANPTDHEHSNVMVTSSLLSTNEETARDKMATEEPTTTDKHHLLSGLEKHRIRRSDVAGGAAADAPQDIWTEGGASEPIYRAFQRLYAVDGAAGLTDHEAGAPSIDGGASERPYSTTGASEGDYPVGGASEREHLRMVGGASEHLYPAGGASESGDWGSEHRTGGASYSDGLHSPDSAVSGSYLPTAMEDALVASSVRNWKRNRVMGSFLGMRGKRFLPPSPEGNTSDVEKRVALQDVEVATSSWPEDFWQASRMGESGHSQPTKRSRGIDGFLGMRGKKGGGATVASGFLGMRGKKGGVVGGFLGMRGKKETLQLKRNPLPFYGMRGKKDGDRMSSYETSEDGGWPWNREEQEEDEEGLSMAKRIPEGFLGMRGKRRARSGNGSAGSEREQYTPARRFAGSGYRNRMREGGALYPNFSAARSFVARSKAMANDRKRQIGSIFVGMRG